MEHSVDPRQPAAARLEDLAALFVFLVSAERDDAWFGGYRASDALYAAGRLIGWDADAIAAVRARLSNGDD